MAEFNVTVAWRTTEVATRDFYLEAETLDEAKDRAIELAKEHGVDGKSEIVDGEYYVTEIGGVRVPDYVQVEPPPDKDPIVRLIGALQWLLDDMHDAGETHSKETGEIFDSVEEAAAALVQNGGALSWYSLEQARAYDRRERVKEAVTTIDGICEVIPEFDNDQADDEGWAIFGRDPGGPPFQLQKCDDSIVFEDDIDAWKFVANKAGEGSVYHKKALEFLKAHTPDEYASIRNAFPDIINDIERSETNAHGTQVEAGEAGGHSGAVHRHSLGESGEDPLQTNRSQVDGQPAEQGSL